MPLSPIREAVSVALYEWVAHGVAPPESSFPTVANGGLVAPDELDFPRIPGVTYSGSINGLRVMDHSDYPPGEGEDYVVLVGRVDEDGNMVDGVRHPSLAVPIGTHTGWNLRREGFAEGEQCAGSGSYIPFAETEEQRRTSGDPRLSIEERYGSLGQFVTDTARQANILVGNRLMLRRGATQLIEETLRSGVANGLP